MWQFFSLYSESFGFLIETFWKSQHVLETATLHDTTSLLRVLTVGFASLELRMPAAARQFQSEQKSN
jgi:hypothetical protein